MKKLFAFAGIICMLAASCAKDDPQTPPPTEPTLLLKSDNQIVTVDETGLTVQVNAIAEGADVFIAVDTNLKEWSISEGPEWITVSKSDEGFSLKIDENTSTQSRNTEYKVSVSNTAGDAEASVTVAQSGVDAATLELSAKTAAISSEGSEVEITFTTNQSEIGIEKSAEWIEYELKEGSIILKAEKNDTGAQRTAEITVTAGTGDNTASDKSAVSQDACLDGFVYVVNTAAADTAVSCPTLSSKAETISITVDFGDGSEPEIYTAGLTSSVKHTYAAAGEYTVKINTDNVISALSFTSNQNLVKVVNNSLDMSDVTTLTRAFYACRQLVEVAANTFEPCVNATTAEYLFYQCDKLTSVPAGIFAALDKVTSFNNCFQNCTALTTVPEGLFAGKATVKTFNNVFYKAGIVAVPSKCFADCTGVTKFSYTICECPNLETVADDIFAGCTKVTDIWSCFTDTPKLKAVPATLFADMKSLADFEYNFQRCTALTSLPASLFDNNRAIKWMDYSIMDCTALTGESPYTVINGTKVHLYERGNYPDDFINISGHDYVFRGAEGLTDYDEILKNGWAQ